MLHTCSRYCLVGKTVPANENNPPSDGRPPEKKRKVGKKCRMNFGQYNEEEEGGGGSNGKEINPFFARITEDKHPRYEGRRDHPYLVQHCGVRPLSWLANCDTQHIIKHDLIVLMKYIASYACKWVSTTSDLINIYANLLKDSPSNTSVKSIT